MRTVSAPELARLLGPDKAYHLRIEIHDSEAVFTDYSVLSGIDWQISASFDEDIDTGVMTGEIRLAREVDGDSLSPLMENSVLNEDSLGAYAPRIHVGRPFKLWEEVTDPGVAPTGTNEHLVCEGFIDEMDWASDDIVLRVSDPGSRLVKTFIEEEEDYGDPAGSPIETEVQAIIDRWVASPPTLVSPAGASGLMLTQWRQEPTNVLEAIRRLALEKSGWEIRYRFPTTGEFMELQHYEPDRAKTVPDVTIGPDSYWALSQIKISDNDIRNVARTDFVDAATGQPDFRIDTDAASIAIHGRRFIGFANLENIDTGTEADALNDAALADLSTPFADHAIELPHLWFLQLGDLVRHQANAVHYDTDQDYAIVAIHREWRDGEGIMTLQTRGKPAGAYARWLALGGGAVLPPITAGVPVLTFFAFGGEGSADGDQPYGMAHFGLVWGRNLDEVRIYAARSLTPNQGQPPEDNRSESAILRRPEGAIPQAEGWESYHDIRTETGDWRMASFTGINLSTGQKNITQIAEIECVDSGTGPTGGPTGTMTVTMNGTTAEIRGLTATDPLAEHLLYRNKVNIMRNAAGAGCDFDDPGLNTSGIYDYTVVAYRNGQTSSEPTTTPPPQGGGGSGTPSTPSVTGPTWASGYPLGGVDGSGNPRVTFLWTGDGGYLASVDVEEGVTSNGPWNTLLAAQAVNPGAAIDDFTYPNGTDRFFRLKGNPIIGTDPVKYSSSKHARYGTSTLP